MKGLRSGLGSLMVVVVAFSWLSCAPGGGDSSGELGADRKRQLE